MEFKRVIFTELDSPTIPKNPFSFISIFISFNILWLLLFNDTENSFNSKIFFPLLNLDFLNFYS